MTSLHSKAIFGNEWHRHLKEGRGGEEWQFEEDSGDDFQEAKQLLDAYKLYASMRYGVQRLFGILSRCK